MVAADTGGKVFLFVFRVTSSKLDPLHLLDVKVCLFQVIICGGSESNQVLVPEKDCWHLETLYKHPLNGSDFQQKWDNKDFLELLEGRVGASAVLTDQVAVRSGKQDPVSTMQKTNYSSFII